MSVDLPPGRADGASIVLAPSSTFVPGSRDNRTLGVMIEDVALTPAGGHFRPTGAVMATIGLATAASVAGFLLCAPGAWLGLLGSFLISLLLAGLLLLDGAFMGVYPARLVPLGIGVGLAGAVVAGLRRRWPRSEDHPEWFVAAGVVLALTALRLALFAHPLAAVGDGIFQVHRAALVHAGNYFFTSVTPKPFFEFPYPVALYITAQPLWRHFPSDLDLVRLLRGITVVVDGLVGLVIYAACRRQWNDRRAALAAAALWLFAPAPMQGLSNANLTNVFGQALFGVGAGILAWNAAGRRQSPSALVIGGAALAGAFLSHFSPVLVGLPLLVGAGMLLVVAGQGQVRRSGVWIVAVTIAAAAASYVVYYSHFHDVYRATASRVFAQREEAPQASKVVAPPAVKFRRWLNGTSDDYGRPGATLLACAAAGLLLLWRERRREALTLLLAAWVAAWAALTAVEIWTPIEVRMNLAAAPAFVGLAAYAIGRLAGRSRLATCAAAVIAAFIAWDGFRLGLWCLGLVSR